MANKKSASVAALSAELQHRAFHPDAGTRSDFRNVNAVFKKLCNFAALDPEHDGAGLLSFSAGDEQTWEEFADDEDALAEAVFAIRSGHDRTPPESEVEPVVQRGPVEAQHTRTFEVSKIAGSSRGLRLEAELVLSFKAYLESEGTQVSAHSYSVGPHQLRNDLADDSRQGSLGSQRLG